MTPQELEATFVEVRKKQSELQGKDVYAMIAFLTIGLGRQLKLLDSLRADVENLKQELRGKNG